MSPNFLFKDLIVVELASVLAGPAVGMFFAELGAKVIKIENKTTGGDVTRKWKLPSENPNDPYSAYYQSINWGKDKLELDLSYKEDLEQAKSILKDADIVISNFKKESARKLQMDYDSIKEFNPSIIYASISAYGEDNPSPGFDVMLQAETGWISMNGPKDGMPTKMPVALIDILAAHQLKQGVLVALLKRQTTQEGSYVSVSLYDAGVAALANQASNWLNVGIVPQRMGSQHPNIAPYGDIFYTKDNIAVILGTGTQKQFEGLCQVLDLEPLISDNRFLNNTQRLSNRIELNNLLERAFRSLTFEHLISVCKKLNVTIAPIHNLEEVFKNPKAQNLILTETMSDGKVKKCVKTAVFKIQ